MYFYSRTSCEVQHLRRGLSGKPCTFLLTHLLRGATSCKLFSFFLKPFLLTHLLRGATSGEKLNSRTALISTHAPLARCNLRQPEGWMYSDISTHAPLARCNCRLFSRSDSKHKFLLTHLLRGATRVINICKGVIKFLLTHLLRGATRLLARYFHIGNNFYSRTSCEVQQA